MTIDNHAEITIIDNGHFVCSLYVYNSVLRLPWSKIVYLKANSEEAYGIRNLVLLACL